MPEVKQQQLTPSGKPGVLASMGLAGSTALIAINFTHPIEVVKTRMQVSTGSVGVGAMLKNEGVGALFKGIQAGYGREATYTSVKLGLYGPLRSLLGADSPDAPFLLKFAAGALSGSLGSVVGNPFDVMKTKMMTNTDKPSVSQTFKELMEGQGVKGFYRGVQANMMRACVLNGTKMACYDVIKTQVVNLTGGSRKDVSVQFLSATGAGFFMTCTVSPFDMMRTKLMNQPAGKNEYSGFMDCFMKTLKNEGPLRFYRGFFPIWARFAPQATLQLVIFEHLLKLTGFKPI